MKTRDFSRRSVGMLLFLCMLFPVQIVGLYETNGAEHTQINEPYALMYDSNDRITTYLNEISEIAEAESHINAMNNLNDEATLERSEALGTTEGLLEFIQTGRKNQIMKMSSGDRFTQKASCIYEKLTEDRYIVKYNSEKSKPISTFLSSAPWGFSIDNSMHIDNTEILVLNERINPKELAQALHMAGADIEIEYIQPDFKMEYASGHLGVSLGLVSGNGTGADDAQIVGISSEIETEEPILSKDPASLAVEKTNEEPVLVAIIDTGIDTLHPELSNFIWTNKGEIAGDGIDNDGNGYIDDIQGWNFRDQNPILYDESLPLQSAHGTHIAGIIAQTAQECNIKLLPLKVFGEDGAYTSHIISAIRYAESLGAKITNCSFGSMELNRALKETMESSPMLFVAAVGNDRADLELEPIYPACFELDNVISVASIDKSGSLSYFSSYSARAVDVSACGQDVYSTLPNNEYGVQSGTSMATAQVTGAAAILAVERLSTAKQLKEELINSANQAASLQQTIRSGRSIDLSTSTCPEDTALDGVQFGGLSIVDMQAGEFHSVALAQNGSVWTWGKNNYGQLGDGTTVNRSTPVCVVGLTGIIGIAVGNDNNFAIRSDGTVWAWGANNYRQLGDGTSVNRTIPVQVIGLNNIVQASAGYDHTLALKSDGSVWAWGWNGYGQLGDGTTINKALPIQVAGLGSSSFVAAGYQHSLAIHGSMQAVYAWGLGDCGQLGDGRGTGKHEDEHARAYPEEAMLEYRSLNRVTINITKIAAGNRCSMAIYNNRAVYWGIDSWNLVVGADVETPALPERVETGVVDISAKGSYAVIAMANGTVKTWGELSGGYSTYADSGELWEDFARPRFEQKQGLSNIVKVAAGGSHTLALDGTGRLWVWGSNSYGQLAVQGATYVSTPVAINMPTLSVMGIMFEQDEYSVSLPHEGAVSVPINAVGVLLSGGVLAGGLDIKYSLDRNIVGVSLDENYGVLTVSSEAQPGRTTLIAEYEGMMATTEILIKKMPTLHFQRDIYSALIDSAPISVGVSAAVYDSMGQVTEGAQIVYSLAEHRTGINIDPTTGIIVIQPTAEPGSITINAKCEALTASTTLVIVKRTSDGAVLELNIVAGANYDIGIKAMGVSNFSGMEITFTYDAALFDIVDLCTFTPEAEKTTGRITETGVVISNIEPGRVQLTVEKDIPSGRIWAGVLTIFRLMAKGDGVSIVQIK